MSRWLRKLLILGAALVTLYEPVGSAGAHDLRDGMDSAAVARSVTNCPSGLPSEALASDDHYATFHRVEAPSS
jgi:hypothetical protein